jgi:chromatin structure-remodeling complex subunit RSC1/2
LRKPEDGTSPVQNPMDASFCYRSVLNIGEIRILSNVLHQRLYQALTSVRPPPGVPHSSPTNFAALRAGPGNVKPIHGIDGDGITGITTNRVLVKDRTFVHEVHYKGWSVKLADWLHLSNPDDPSRPIIAQVFKCWVSEAS